MAVPGLTPEGDARLRSFESKKLYTYDDATSKRVGRGDPVKGNVTAGIGHTGRDVVAGMVVTDQMAEDWYREDVAEAANLVSRLVKVPLTDGQTDALISLAFNVGPGAKGKRDGLAVLKDGKRPQLIQKLNRGDYDGAKAEFLSWCHSGGSFNQGLRNRREQEVAMWNRGAFVASGSVQAAPAKPTIWTKATKTATGIGVAGLAAAGNAISQDPVGSIQSTVAAVKQAHELGLRDDQPTPGIVIQEQHAAHSANVMAWSLGFAALVIVALVVTVIWQRVHHVKEVSG